MTQTAANNLDLLAGVIAGGAVVAQFWVWSNDPVNRDRYFAVALLFVIIAVIAYFVRFLP